MVAPFLWVADRVRGWHPARRRLRVLVHRAYFMTPGSAEYFFLKVTNRSPQREVEITHAWFESTSAEPRAPAPARG